MDERFAGRSEEVVSSAAVAGAGAVLVGVGIALAFLLGKRGGGGGGTSRRCEEDGQTAWLTIAADGSASCTDIRLRLRDPDDPTIPYFVRWCVTNRGREERVIDLENFSREESDAVSPLDHRDFNRRPWKVPGGAIDRQFLIKISPKAIAELIESTEDDHEYKYDVWVDRVRRLDPEIAIIRR